MVIPAKVKQTPGLIVFIFCTISLKNSSGVETRNPGPFFADTNEAEGLNFFKSTESFALK